MKSLFARNALCLLVAGVVLIPSSAFSGDESAVRSLDVLLADGVLTGTVVDSEAQPLAGETVQIMFGSKLVATTTSTEAGEFAVRGLRQGPHQLVVNGEPRSARFWDAATAPPSAVSSVSLVKSDANIVRGNDDDRRLAGGLLMLGAFGGVVATTLYYTLDENADSPASP